MALDTSRNINNLPLFRVQNRCHLTKLAGLLERYDTYSLTVSCCCCYCLKNEYLVTSTCLSSLFSWWRASEERPWHEIRVEERVPHWPTGSCLGGISSSVCYLWASLINKPVSLGFSVCPPLHAKQKLVPWGPSVPGTKLSDIPGMVMCSQDLGFNWVPVTVLLGFLLPCIFFSCLFIVVENVYYKIYHLNHFLIFD